MRLVKLLSILALLLTFVYAEPVSQSGEKDGYEIKLTSVKSLVVGDNDFFVQLSKDGNIITSAKVRAKFFMPEMPGMPYMEYKDNAVLQGNKYKMMINFSMGGTWQYHVQFKLDGKKYTYRGSVNLGQSNGGMKCAAGKCASGKCGGGK